jgi:hypothetical protein
LGPSVARGVILDVVARGSVDDLAGGLVAFLFDFDTEQGTTASTGLFCAGENLCKILGSLLKFCRFI